MRFNIITPTYKRPDKLRQVVASVLNQTYHDWRLFIVNDSPADLSYEPIEVELKKDRRIIYVKNTENMGVNFSRNTALDKIQSDSTDDDWVVFLDDDDSLSKDALKTLVKINAENPEEKWIVTNRIMSDGTSLTKIPSSGDHYSYIWGVLLTKKLKGDATHCISLKTIRDIRFPKSIKQAEEWLFYYELSLQIKKFFYYSHGSTISAGYSTDGLNFRERTRKDRLNDIRALIKESRSRGIFFHPTILLYFLARLIMLTKIGL